MQLQCTMKLILESGEVQVVRPDPRVPPVHGRLHALEGNVAVGGSVYGGDSPFALEIS
jgi:hypothetical protein